jgi:hypothetical protein
MRPPPQPGTPSRNALAPLTMTAEGSAKGCALGGEPAERSRTLTPACGS